MKKKILVLGIIVFLLPIFIKLSQVFADAPQPKPTPEDIRGADPGEENDKKSWVSLFHSGQGHHPLFYIQFMAVGKDDEVAENIRFILIQSGLNLSKENIRLLTDLGETLKYHWINIEQAHHRNNTGPIYKGTAEKLETLTEEFFERFSHKERVRLYCAIEWLDMAQAGLKDRYKNVSTVKKVETSELSPIYVEWLRKRFPNNNEQVLRDFADTVYFVHSRQFPGELPQEKRKKFIEDKKKERSRYLETIKIFEHFKSL